MDWTEEDLHHKSTDIWRSTNTIDVTHLGYRFFNKRDFLVKKFNLKEISIFCLRSKRFTFKVKHKRAFSLESIELEIYGLMTKESLSNYLIHSCLKIIIEISLCLLFHNIYFFCYVICDWSRRLNLWELYFEIFR